MSRDRFYIQVIDLSESEDNPSIRNKEKKIIIKDNIDKFNKMTRRKK